MSTLFLFVCLFFNTGSELVWPFRNSVSVTDRSGCPNLLFILVAQFLSQDDHGDIITVIMIAEINPLANPLFPPSPLSLIPLFPTPNH